MTVDEFQALFGAPRPVIGMLHLGPLPGAPDYDSMDSVTGRLLADCEALLAGGVHGLIIENYGDAPYYPGRVPSHTVAYMTALAARVRAAAALPLGVNILRNDGASALAVAAASGARFIRVNVHTGARVSGEGLLQGRAHELLRYRRELGADVKIFADVDVKHSAALGSVNLAAEVSEAVIRGKADAVIVSGPATGSETALADLRTAKAAAGETPVLAGSGVTAANVSGVLSVCDGVIVGTGLKCGGVTANPVDPERVRALVKMAAL